MPQSLRQEVPGLVSEVALVLVTITAALSLDRIFIDTEHRRHLIITALVIHGVLMLTRRLRAGVFLSLVASLIALILTITQTLFRDSSRFGIPTRDTMDLLNEQSRAAWADFNTVRAPTVSTAGFILATIIAIWAVAFLSDWAAFRLRAAGEALVPGVAVVIFSALLTIALPGGEIRQVVFFLAAAVFFLVAHRSASRVSSGTWLGNETSGAYRSLMAGGAMIAVVAVGVGLVAGPRIPGADEEALVELNDIGNAGPSERIAESPLIDIRSRLVDLPNIEAFTVETNSPGYWRTMALDSFDGSTWTLKADFSDADGELENTFQTDVATEEVLQRFTITGLDMDWLPAAYTATEIQVETDQRVTYESALSTLIVDASTSIDDMQYQVRSARPIVTSGDLVNSPPSNIDDRYTELPADFDPRIRDMAEVITQNATDDFGKALALQDWFRKDGGFSYSLADVPPGHSQNAIINFLNAKVGYCEQFAGTYAAMARSIGLPTRIAVGFTDGERDPINQNLYRVSGKHAHSWPEVYIEGAGWLHFEPTPGRGAASSAAYTGFQQQQADQTAEAISEGAQSLPDPTPGPGALVVEGAPEAPEPQSDGVEDIDPGGEPLAGLDPGSNAESSLSRTWWIILLTIAGIAAYAVAIPLLKRQRRKAERARAADHRERVDVAWRHASADMRVKGVTRAPSETHLEYAERAARDLNVEQVTKLGELASAAAFSDGDLPEWVADEAESFEDAIKAVLDSRSSTLDRTLEELNPKPLLTRS